MRTIKPWLYATVIIYTILFLVIGVLVADSSMVSVFFIELSGKSLVGDSKALLYGVNTTIKTFLIFLISVFYFISYLIVKNKKKSEGKQRFYIIQMFFFVLFGLSVRFHMFYFMKLSCWDILAVFCMIQVFLYIILTDLKKLSSSNKNKLFGILILSIFLLFIEHGINPIDGNKNLTAVDLSTYITMINLTFLWIIILMLTMSWDIMYRKINKLKKISNVYYRERNLKKNN